MTQSDLDVQPAAAVIHPPFLSTYSFNLGQMILAQRWSLNFWDVGDGQRRFHSGVLTRLEVGNTV